MSQLNEEGAGRSEFSQPSAFFWTGVIPAGTQPWMTALGNLNGKGQIAWLEWQREWANFLARRFQEDIKLVGQLTNCTAPQAAIFVYSDFVQKASADYQQEWIQLIEIGQSSASEMSSCAQQVIEASALNSVSGKAA